MTEDGGFLLSQIQVNDKTPLFPSILDIIMQQEIWYQCKECRFEFKSGVNFIKCPLCEGKVNKEKLSIEDEMMNKKFEDGK